MKKRLVVALLCAVLSMMLGWVYLRRAELRVTGGRMAQVLVAAREIPSGTRISVVDLAVRTIPEAYLHPESVLATPADEQKLIDRVCAGRLVPGQQLLWSDLEGARVKLGRRLAGAIDKGHRAITIPVDAANSFGNQIRATDRIDVLGSFSRAGSEYTFTVLQNVLVIAVGGKKEDAMVEGEPQMTVTHVTLLVDLDDAEILVFAQQHGTLHLVMHGEDDIDVVTGIRQKTFADLAGAPKPPVASRKAGGRVRELKPDTAGSGL